MVIDIKNRKADFSEINIQYKYKTPIIDTLYSYWQGSDTEFMEYTKNIGLQFVGVNPQSLYEVHKYANENLEKIQKAFQKQNIGKFDFRLVSAFKSKNIQNFNEDDYLKMTLDLSNYKDENIKNEIKEIFLNSKSRSLLDFKNIDGDVCEMFYYKKGLYQSENDIKIVTARDRVTLLENWQDAKDNNFICSGFLLNMSKKMHDLGLGDEKFSFTYTVNNGIKRDMTKSVNEIMMYENMSQDEKQKFLKIETMKKEANAEAIKEIKEENANSRNSLKQDSNDEILLQKSGSQVRFNVRDLQEQTIQSNNIENLDEILQEQNKKTANSIEEIIKNSFEFYKQKEKEKVEIRLQKAEKEAQNAYFDLKQNLNDGLSILDGINFIKQKYRNEDTIHFASTLFARDILDAKSKDNQIENLKNIIKEQEKDNQKTIEAIEKREKTISELKSTLTKKSNEFNLLKEEFQTEKDNFENIIVKKINDLKNEYEKTISNNNDIIEESKSIIEEIEQENEKLKNENVDLYNKNLNLESNLKDNQHLNEKLSMELGFLKEKANNLENLQKENYELKADNKTIQEQQKYYQNENATLKEQNTKYEVENRSLNEQNRILQTQINTLQERMRGYEAQVDNFMKILNNNQNNQEDKSVKEILGNEPDIYFDKEVKKQK